jgi:hypothetical protein
MRVSRTFGALLVVVAILAYTIPVTVAVEQDFPRYSIRTTCLAAKRCDESPSCKIVERESDPYLRWHTVQFTNEYTTNTKAYLEVCLAGSGNGWTQERVCYPVGSPGIIPKNDEERALNHEQTKQSIYNATVEMCRDSFINYQNLPPGAKQSIDRICDQDAKDRLSKLVVPLFNYRGLSYDGKTIFGAPLSAGTRIKGLQWESWQPESIDHQWNLVEYFIPQTSSDTQPVGGEGSEIRYPTGAALQHGEQGFVTPTPVPPITLGDIPQSKCSVISYDPYGRVFDAQTLKPVMGARVVLYQDDGNGVYRIPNIPFVPKAGYVTGEDGVFSFVVPDGRYKLHLIGTSEVVPQILNEATQKSQYALDEAQIASYDSSANSVIQVVNGRPMRTYTDIYPLQSPYPAIIQQGAIEHRDLPALPGVFASSLVLQYSFQIKDSAAGRTTLFGRVSQPYTEVVLVVQGLSGSPQPQGMSANNLTNPGALRDVTKVTSDIWGRFELSVRGSDFAKNELVHGLRLKSGDETVVAKDVGLIPAYLEGYARDTNGAILAKTMVGLYAPSTLTPLVTTITDVRGYYQFSPSEVPNRDFVVRYGSPGSKTFNQVLSMRDVQNANERFYASEKRNPFIPATFVSKVKAADIPRNPFIVGDTQTSDPLDSKDYQVVPTAYKTPAAHKAGVSERSSASGMIVFVVVFGLLGIGGFLAYTIILKKRQSQAGSDQTSPLV